MNAREALNAILEDEMTDFDELSDDNVSDLSDQIISEPGEEATSALSIDSLPELLINSEVIISRDGSEKWTPNQLSARGRTPAENILRNPHGFSKASFEEL